jgi:hypothetical protein
VNVFISKINPKRNMKFHVMDVQKGRESDPVNNTQPPSPKTPGAKKNKKK